MIMKLKKEEVLPTIINALKEDVGSGDITSDLLFDPTILGMAAIVAKQDAIIAGIDVVKWIVDSLNEKMEFMALSQDGDEVKKGKKVLSIKGPIRTILAGERVMLNFLGRLSGIATLTSQFVKEVEGTRAKIFDTRKTTPGLRILEKYAVSTGRGKNHRMGLWEGVLIKDNHISGCRVKGEGCPSTSPLDKLGTLLGTGRVDVIRGAIIKVRDKGYRDIEVEVENLSEFEEAIEVGADIIMLDNMKLEDIKKAVKMRDKRDKEQGEKVILEASGGITLENVREIAKTGVDRISIGALTHSASSIDFSLELV